MPNPKVVILCMENRSFDGYFGTFPGAQGFSSSTSAAFQQRNGQNDIVTPFRASTFSSYPCTDPNHDWLNTQKAWDSGLMGGWYNAQSDQSDPNTVFNFSMSYNSGNDVPYHWTLAQNFLLCDSYFCSVLGPTYPNRMFLMSGTIFSKDTAQGKIIKCSNSSIDPDLYTPSISSSLEFPWQSYPAMLASGTTSWKIYDDQLWQPTWLAWPDNSSQQTVPPIYFGTEWPNQIYELNVLAYLQDAQGNYKGPGSGFAGIGQSNYSKTSSDAGSSNFAIDAASSHPDALTDISWIVPPFFCSEHPQYNSSDGESYIARVVDAVLNSPWWIDPGIVLIITYDEAGGFFDHVAPPTSPKPTPGSTGESWVSVPNGSSDSREPGPVGGGLRVPTIIVSPWTVNAGVSSAIAPGAVFDHTSVIQYLEEITGTTCTNLPENGWRRNTFSSLSELIDTTKAPVPKSQIDMATSSDADAWRIDALTRRFGGNSTNNQTVLPSPSPTPSQSWPPLLQVCTLSTDSEDLAQDDIKAILQKNNLKGDAGFQYACFLYFTADGFEPNELNMGEYTPASYVPIAPQLTKSITYRGHNATVSLIYAGIISANNPLNAIPQQYKWQYVLIVQGDVVGFAPLIQINGSLTSRLTWNTSLSSFPNYPPVN